MKMLIIIIALIGILIIPIVKAFCWNPLELFCIFDEQSVLNTNLEKTEIVKNKFGDTKTRLTEDGNILFNDKINMTFSCIDRNGVNLNFDYNFSLSKEGKFTHFVKPLDNNGVIDCTYSFNISKSDRFTLLENTSELVFHGKGIFDYSDLVRKGIKIKELIFRNGLEFKVSFDKSTLKNIYQEFDPEFRTGSVVDISIDSYNATGTALLYCDYGTDQWTYQVLNTDGSVIYAEQDIQAQTAFCSSTNNRGKIIVLNDTYSANIFVVESADDMYVEVWDMKEDVEICSNVYPNGLHASVSGIKISDDSFMVFYHNVTGSLDQLYGDYFDSDCNQLTDTVILSDGSDQSNFQYMNANQLNNTGGWVVAWDDRGTGILRGSAGSSQNDEMNIDYKYRDFGGIDIGSGVHIPISSVVMNSTDNNYIVGNVFQQYNTSGHSLYYTRVNKAGTIEKRKKIANVGVSEAKFESGYVGDGHIFIYVYNTSTTENQILIDYNGNVLQNIKTNDNIGTDESSSVTTYHFGNSTNLCNASTFAFTHTDSGNDGQINFSYIQNNKIVSWDGRCSPIISGGGPSDSCSPTSPLTDDYIYDCSDNCRDENLNANGFNVLISGTGSWQGNIANYNELRREGIDKNNRCYIELGK